MKRLYDKFPGTFHMNFKSGNFNRLVRYLHTGPRWTVMTTSVIACCSKLLLLVSVVGL